MSLTRRDMEANRGAIIMVPVILLILVSFTSSVAAINCVQCLSESSIECIDTPPPPKPCDASARYCIVVRETMSFNASVLTVTRTCSPVDLGSKCHESFSLSGENVLVCHKACGEDGCNNAPQRQLNKPPEANKTKKSSTSASISVGSSSSLMLIVMFLMTFM